MDYRALDLDEVVGMVEHLEPKHRELSKAQENYSTRWIRESIDYKIYRHSFIDKRRKRRW